MSGIVFRWLGRVPFEETWRAQEAFVERKAEDPSVPDEFWLLEHDPVYTIGRTPDRTSLRGGEALPHPVFEINRGGQATWHGPGQLVGYALFDLKRRGRDLHAHLRGLEESLIALLGGYSIVAERREGLTGVWVGGRKIASIGVGVRRWISMHGFALNVCGTLGAFGHITPCGIAGVEMTSMEREGVPGETVERVAYRFAGGNLAGSTDFPASRGTPQT